MLLTSVNRVQKIIWSLYVLLFCCNSQLMFGMNQGKNNNYSLLSAGQLYNAADIIITGKYTKEDAEHEKQDLTFKIDHKRIDNNTVQALKDYFKADVQKLGEHQLCRITMDSLQSALKEIAILKFTPNLTYINMMRVQRGENGYKAQLAADILITSYCLYASRSIIQKKSSVNHTSLINPDEDDFELLFTIKPTLPNLKTQNREVLKLKREVLKLNKEITRLNDIITIKTNASESHLKDIDTITKLNESVKGDNNRLYETVNKLNQEVFNLKNQLVQKSKELEVCEKAKTQLQEEQTKLKNDITTSEKTIEELHKELQNEGEATRKLNGELVLARQEIEELEKQIENNKTQLSVLSKNVEQFKVESAELTKQSDEITSQLNKTILQLKAQIANSTIGLAQQDLAVKDNTFSFKHKALAILSACVGLLMIMHCSATYGNSIVCLEQNICNFFVEQFNYGYESALTNWIALKNISQ